MTKHAMYSRLTVLGLLLLMTTGCGPSNSAAFKKASDYWRGLKDPESIDAGSVFNLIRPLFNPAGIQYLIDKMERGANNDSEISVVCLATIYETLLNAPSEESRQLREPIDKSSLFKLAALYSRKGSNEAIRSTLAEFVKMPKKEAATTPEIPVSGAETWDIAGRTYKIHDTHINMRHPNGPIFTVVLDQSRSSVSKMINPLPDILPKKAIAKYALEKGYFHKAQKICVTGEKVNLQARIDVWIGQKTRDGFGAVSSFEGGYDVRDLSGPTEKTLVNEQVDGTRP